MSCVWTVLVESCYAEINFGICYFAVWWFVYSFVFKKKLIVLQAHFAAYIIKCCQCGIDYKKGEQLNYVCEILQWKLIAQLLYYISKFCHSRLEIMFFMLRKREAKNWYALFRRCVWRYVCTLWKKNQRSNFKWHLTKINVFNNLISSSVEWSCENSCPWWGLRQSALGIYECQPGFFCGKNML